MTLDIRSLVEEMINGELILKFARWNRSIVSHYIVTKKGAEFAGIEIEPRQKGELRR